MAPYLVVEGEVCCAVARRPSGVLSGTLLGWRVTREGEYQQEKLQDLRDRLPT